MEQVVATVTGYHGSERFNLIKLISHAGANYVGSMSKSITHLVCWKFEGNKYDIARKLRIHIVNHRWVEDCVKEGRRVPEDSYILQSGYEVGPLLLEAPVTVQASSLSKNKAFSDRLCDIGSARQNTDFSSGFCGITVLEDSCLVKKLGESTSYRLSRKGKRNSSCEVSKVAKHSRKGRRALQNDVDKVVINPIVLDLSSDDELCRTNRQHHEDASDSSFSGALNINIPENREGIDAGICSQSRTDIGGSDEIGQSRGSNKISSLRGSTTSVEDPLPEAQTSVDLCSSAAEKFADGYLIDNVDGLPTSVEVSCVICWTDFSSTRGILPCGHRYCFSCIQNWADCKVAMGKVATCPMCKTSFSMIKKVDDAVTTDQKVYSQTVPCDYSVSDIFIPIRQELPDNSLEVGACVVCLGREPEDLLENCDVCRTRRIHSYCMDPPLRPWICSHCKELRMLYRNHSY